MRNPLALYLKEIAATPLLTASEEHDLAMRVASGDMDARDHMIRANLRFVVSIARYFQGRGLGLEDLIAEGNRGLIDAVEMFDPLSGYRVTTYAKHHIKHSIRKGIARQVPLVRSPMYALELIAKHRKDSGYLKSLPSRKQNILLSALVATGSQSPTSIQSDTLSSLCVYPESLCDTENETQPLHAIRHLLGCLNDNQQFVLIYYLGLLGCPPKTMEDIGRELGVTKQRAHQIKKRAMQKMQDAVLNIGYTWEHVA